MTLETKSPVATAEAEPKAVEEQQTHGRSGIAAAYANRDLTEGSISKTLWFLAWPSMISGALMTVDHLAEFVWAGFLGFRAVASIGVAQGWVQVFNTGRMGLDTAARAMISRAIGERDIDRANHIAGQALVFNAIVMLSLMTLGIIFTDSLLRTLGVSEAMIMEGSDYLRWRFASTTSFGLMWTSGNMLQAAGDSLTPMKAQAVGRLINIVLIPVLMFGWLGMPALGLMGAALAATVAQGIAAIWTLRALFVGTSRLHVSLADMRPDLPICWRMIRLGVPASITTGERSVAQLILVGLVAPFGDISLAAYSITQRVQMFVGFGQQGLGQAAGVLVGQNLGARKLPRAMTTTWWALGYSTAISAVIGGLILMFPLAFLSIFSREQHLLELAVPWLQIMTAGFVVMGASNVFMQVFNTAGETLIPMLVTLGSIWGVQQPFALILSGSTSHWSILGWDVSLPAVSGLGEFGIAWAIVIAMTVRILVYLPFFLWGSWWKHRVY